MQKFSQRVFKGLSTDISVEDISELATPLCQDVCVTPRGALSTPLGMTKWNTTSLGFINGGFDYRGRVGQYVLSFASTAGYGYPTGVGAGVAISGGAAVSGTIDVSGKVDGSGRAAGPVVKVFTTLTLEIPTTTYNGENFTITATAKDQNGDVFDLSGTVVLTENGSGTLSSGTLAMSGGVATSSTMQYLYLNDEAAVTITGTIATKSGNDTMATKGYTIDLSIPASTTNGVAFTTTVTAKTFNGNTYTNASGTVSLTENGTGSILPTSLTMTAGVATGDVTYKHPKTESVTMTATLGAKTDNATMTANGYTINLALTGTVYDSAGLVLNVLNGGTTPNTDSYDITVTIKRADGSTATEYQSGTYGIISLASDIGNFHKTDASNPKVFTITNGVGSATGLRFNTGYNGTTYLPTYNTDKSLTWTATDANSFMASTQLTPTSTFIYGTWTMPTSWTKYNGIDFFQQDCVLAITGGNITGTIIPKRTDESSAQLYIYPYTGSTYNSSGHTYTNGNTHTRSVFANPSSTPSSGDYRIGIVKSDGTADTKSITISAA